VCASHVRGGPQPANSAIEIARITLRLTGWASERRPVGATTDKVYTARAVWESRARGRPPPRPQSPVRRRHRGTPSSRSAPRRRSWPARVYDACSARVSRRSRALRGAPEGASGPGVVPAPADWTHRLDSRRIAVRRMINRMVVLEGGLRVQLFASEANWRGAGDDR